MGINRPTNLNIRDTPGNGSIVGPSTTPTCVETTTVCTVTQNSIGACANLPLGTQHLVCCRCPCCDIVCGCDCVVCDRTIPPAMWKTSEQYEAKSRDAWGADTSSTGPTSCLCNINPGFTGSSNSSSPAGGYVICMASSKAWIVAPSSTQVTRAWGARADAVTTANQAAGCGDWFVPTCGQLQDPGAACNVYWDSYSGNYYSNTQSSGNCAWYVSISNGSAADWAGGPHSLTNPRNVRAFRCVSY